MKKILMLMQMWKAMFLDVMSKPNVNNRVDYSEKMHKDSHCYRKIHDGSFLIVLL